MEKILLDPKRVHDPSEVLIDKHAQETVKRLYAELYKQCGSKWSSEIELIRGSELFTVSVCDVGLSGTIKPMLSCSDNASAQTVGFNPRTSKWIFLFRATIISNEFVEYSEDTEVLRSIRSYSDSIKIVYDTTARGALNSSQTECMREYVYLINKDIICDVTQTQFTVHAVYGQSSFVIRMYHTEHLDIMVFLRLSLDNFRHAGYTVDDVQIASSFQGYLIKMKQDTKRKREEDYSQNKK